MAPPCGPLPLDSGGSPPIGTGATCLHSSAATQSAYLSGPESSGPVDLDHHRVEFLIVHQQWFPVMVHNFTVHPCAVRLIRSKPDLLVPCPGHSCQLRVDNPQPLLRYGVQLVQCFETVSCLLGLDFLWGRVDLWVWAVSILRLPPLLPCLRWLSWRHHASELLRERTRSLRLHTATTWIVLLPCFATERRAHVNSFLCDKTRDLSVQAFAVMKCCRGPQSRRRALFAFQGCSDSGSQSQPGSVPCALLRD